MNGLISWWAKNSVAANLLMFGIIIAGALSFTRMEREVSPTVQVPWVQITVAWPGAAPQEVEEQIILRVEEALVDLDNVVRIQSTATEGSANVVLEADYGVDMGDFINRVKLRVDGVSNLPSDSFPAQVREIVTRDELIRIAVHGTADEQTRKRVSEQIRDEIALLPGASIVELFGARDEEVSIEISEVALRRYDLTFDEVSQAIRNSSVNLSSGRVRTQTGDIQLRARNLADTQTDFEDIIVRQTADGALIRVGDVATVIDGFEDVNLLATMNGDPAILVQVMTSEKMNVVRTSNSVKEWFEDAQDRMPDGIELTWWFDSSKLYFDRIGTISQSAFYGLLLVMATLILFLRPTVALWVSIGIATAFAGAFIFLPANGVSLNMISLFAFLLVLGVVVDDAIIVGESIHRQVEHGTKGVRASIIGAQLVSKPVIFAVLTTMIAFAPWMMISSVTRAFTAQISIIVIAALTFSLIESLFILPAHLKHMKPRKEKGWFSKFQGGIADSIMLFADKVYRPFVTASINLRYVTVAVFIFFFMVSVGLTAGGWIRFSFMPEIENEQVAINVTLPEGAPFTRSLDVLSQLQSAQEALEAQINEEQGGDARLIENWYTRARNNDILALVQLAPSEERALSTKETSERLRELLGDIPDAEDISVSYTLNQPGPDIEFAVNAPDLGELRIAVDELETELRKFSAVYDVRDNIQSATDEIRLHLKEGAQKTGLTLGEISRQVRQAYYGEEIQRLPREGEDVRVMVRYGVDERSSLDSLADFRVRTPDGREVPLYAVADIEFAPSLKRINRRERQRSAVVSAEIRDGEDRKTITDVLEEEFFPDWEKRHPNVTRGAIGDAEAEQEFFAEMQSLYIIALFTMYTLLAIAFGSYWQPLLIMTAIPFGYMGAIFGHGLMGMGLSLFSFFGVGAAAGVVINDNLVLVDYINRLRNQGVGAYRALIEAGVARFRPILLTSVTTFIGLLPLMAERSTQAQFLIPTAVGLAYGVIFATFVTLLLVPALYAVGVDIARLSRGLWTGKKQPGFGHGDSESGEPLPDMDDPDYIEEQQARGRRGRRPPDDVPDAPPAPAE